MGQQPIEAAGPFEHLRQPLAGRCANEDVSHRSHDRRPRCRRLGGIEQRQQLEAHLPAAEGEHLDHQQPWPTRLECSDQSVAAARLEGVVDRPSRRIEQRREIRARALHRLQLQQLGTCRDRAPRPAGLPMPASPRAPPDASPERGSPSASGGRCRAGAGPRRRHRRAARQWQGPAPPPSRADRDQRHPLHVLDELVEHRLAGIGEAVIELAPRERLALEHPGDHARHFLGHRHGLPGLDVGEPEAALLLDQLDAGRLDVIGGARRVEQCREIVGLAGVAIALDEGVDVASRRRLAQDRSDLLAEAGQMVC